jgi:hypothetical protein
MNWIDNIGIIGAFLLLGKTGMHIYLKRRIDKTFDVGPSGRMLNPELFLPVFDEVAPPLKVLKKLCNVVYLVSIAMIIAFVIANGMRQK